MAPRSRGGGALSTRGTSRGGPVLDLDITISGLERTSDGFKRVRRDINTAMRDAQQKIGERTVLPLMRARLQPVAGRWAGTMYVKRDRTDVFIGSKLKRKENRALGWLDFGGQRDQDKSRRLGPHVIVRTLDEKQTQIRDQTRDAVLKEFRDAGFDTD